MLVIFTVVAKFMTGGSDCLDIIGVLFDPASRHKKGDVNLFPFEDRENFAGIFIPPGSGELREPLYRTQGIFYTEEYASYLYYT